MDRYLQDPAGGEPGLRLQQQSNARGKRFGLDQDDLFHNEPTSDNNNHMMTMNQQEEQDEFDDDDDDEEIVNLVGSWNEDDEDYDDDDFIGNQNQRRRRRRKQRRWLLTCASCSVKCRLATALLVVLVVMVPLGGYLYHHHQQSSPSSSLSNGSNQTNAAANQTNATALVAAIATEPPSLSPTTQTTTTAATAAPTAPTTASPSLTTASPTTAPQTATTQSPSATTLLPSFSPTQQPQTTEQPSKAPTTPTTSPSSSSSLSQSTQQQQQNGTYYCPDNDLGPVTVPYEEYLTHVIGNALCSSEIPPQHCHCESPLVPRRNRYNVEYWNRAFRRNRELSNASSSANLVLYGDARIEHWLGTHSGVHKEHHEGTRGVYQQLFNTSTTDSAAVRGVPLGIAGDGCSQLLFRLQNGELPDPLQPRVIWVLIGSVDLDALCSVGTIVTGSIAVVRYLQHARPNAIVVMNSLLPWLSGGSGGETPAEAAVSLHDTPIWQKTQQVNHELECWAQSQPQSVGGSGGGIEFFNATPFFLNQAGTHVDPDLMESFEYPTAAGALKWGQGILDRVQELLTNNS